MNLEEHAYLYLLTTLILHVKPNYCYNNAIICHTQEAKAGMKPTT